MSGDMVLGPVVAFPSLRFSSLMDTDTWFKQSSISDGLTVTEDDAMVYVEAALPGVMSENISISYYQGVLHIQGEVVEDEHKKNRKSYRMMTRSYSYEIIVPAEVDQNGEVEAVCENGIVYVSLPKLHAEAPKKIAVKKRAAEANVNSAAVNENEDSVAETPEMNTDVAVDAGTESEESMQAADDAKLETNDEQVDKASVADEEDVTGKEDDVSKTVDKKENRSERKANKPDIALEATSEPDEELV